MSNKLNLVGHIFGEYKNIVISETEKREGGCVIYKCKCSQCGNTNWELSTNRIKHDKPLSCGCINNRSIAYVEHGLSKTKFYRHWSKMKSRCSIACEEYKHYKNNKIVVDEKWLNFIKFKEDMYEEYIKHIEEYGEKNTTLDRIDNDKGYSKENCRWVTFSIQLFNRDFSKGNRNTPILATRILDGYNIITYNASIFSLRIFNKYKNHISSICKGEAGRTIEKGWTFKYITREEWDCYFSKNIDYIISLENFKLSIPYNNIIVSNIKF